MACVLLAVISGEPVKLRGVRFTQKARPSKNRSRIVLVTYSGLAIAFLRIEKISRPVKSTHSWTCTTFALNWSSRKRTSIVIIPATSYTLQVSTLDTRHHVDDFGGKRKPIIFYYCFHTMISVRASFCQERMYSLVLFPVFFRKKGYFIERNTLLSLNYSSSGSLRMFYFIYERIDTLIINAIFIKMSRKDTSRPRIK